MDSPIPLPDDSVDLGRFGYVQELFRNLGGFSNFAISLSCSRRADQLVAIVYTLGICLVLMMPPNELAGKMFLGLVAALFLVYFLNVRRRFSGPERSTYSRFVQIGEMRR